MDRIIKTKIFIILLMVRAMPTPLEMIIGKNSILKNIFTQISILFSISFVINRRKPLSELNKSIFK